MVQVYFRLDLNTDYFTNLGFTLYVMNYIILRDGCGNSDTGGGGV